jgi:hypothetical protein
MLLLPLRVAPADEPGAGQTCVDVKIGSAQSYGCINQELRHIVESAPRLVAVPDLHAGSSASAIGTFDRTATQERLGDAFGHSLVPQRPASPPPVSMFQAR